MNLISVGVLAEKGFVTVFGPSGATVYDPAGNEFCRAPRHHGVYLLHMRPSIPTDVCCAYRTVPYPVLHWRFAHPNAKILPGMIRAAAVTGLPEDVGPKEISDGLCTGCLEGKMTRTPISKQRSVPKPQFPLVLVHVDTCGPVRPPTVHNEVGFLLITDGMSHFRWTYLFKSRTELPDLLVNWGVTIQR